jgi:transposase-like protein
LLDDFRYNQGAMSTCPHCLSVEHQFKAGMNPSGSQRFLCGECKKKYTPSPALKGYAEPLKKEVVLMCFEGRSFRSIAREKGLSAQTVVNWINDYMAHNTRAIYKHPKSNFSKKWGGGV